MTAPVDHEAVPGMVECEEATTAFVNNEAVPRVEAQSDLSFRAPAKRGLASLSDAGLTFLGTNSARPFSACRLSTKRLSAVIGSQ
jgi:hypothetical protein